MRDNSHDINYAYAPPLALPSEKADLLDKIKPNRVVEEVFRNLLGQVEDDKGNWRTNTILKEKSLSLRGAWDMKTLMLPVSSQNVALSKLKDHEIRGRALNIAKAAQEMCLMNWKAYNVRGRDQLRFVHEVVFSNTFITLKQPQDEGIRRLIGSIGSGEIGNQNMPQEESIQGGMLSSIFRK
jgi:hypothetical protein